MPDLVETLRGLFADGRIIDLVLAVLGVELLAIAAWRWRRAKPGRPLSLIFAALPGVCLLLALRFALSGADWIWPAFWLSASFPAHLCDLWRRPP